MKTKKALHEGLFCFQFVSPFSHTSLSAFFLKQVADLALRTLTYPLSVYQIPKPLVESGNALQPASVHEHDDRPFREKTHFCKLEGSKKSFSRVNGVKRDTRLFLEVVDKFNEFVAEFGIAAHMKIIEHLPIGRGFFATVGQ